VSESIEQARAKLVVLADWIRRDLDRRRLTQESQHRIAIYLGRALEAAEYALVEIQNGSFELDKK
jgi:uncharacterized protein (DUF2384 family)